MILTFSGVSSDCINYGIFLLDIFVLSLLLSKLHSEAFIQEIIMSVALYLHDFILLIRGPKLNRPCLEWWRRSSASSSGKNRRRLRFFFEISSFLIGRLLVANFRNFWIRLFFFFPPKLLPDQFLSTENPFESLDVYVDADVSDDSDANSDPIFEGSLKAKISPRRKSLSSRYPLSFCFSLSLTHSLS